MSTESWEVRPALGQRGNIGQLYNIREDKILGTSILKTSSQSLPARSVQSTTYNSFTCETTITDSLEEKFSKLQISADFKASLLCGMLSGGWGVDYISTQKTHSRAKRASIILKMKLKSEDLLLTNDELREYLDLEALHTTDATHVICGLEWGAQTIVTAEMGSTDTDRSQAFHANLGNPEDAKTSQPGVIDRVLGAIGKFHVSGEAGLDSTYQERTSNLKFKIISDIGDPGIMPKGVEDVLEFVKSSRSDINATNAGKGVPIIFHLRPISDIAHRFSVQIKHITIMQRLDQECIDEFVKLLEKRRAIRLELEEYQNSLEEHSFCVPVEQIEKARDQVEEAMESEDRLSWNLRIAVEGFRNGKKGISDLQAALRKSKLRLSIPSDYPSILQEYIHKIQFAKMVKQKGGTYIHNDPAELDRILIFSGAPDVYVLFYSEESRHHTNWNKTLQKITDLLGNRNSSYDVTVVDCDFGDLRKLEKPVIERHRNGKVVVTDVVEDHRELEEECLVRCCDENKADRSPSAKAPPESRMMRVPCPIRSCHTAGRYLWTCPDCRHQVSFGFTDDYLYCGCYRYHFSLAVFKCRNNNHGKDYVHHNETYLRKLLGDLEFQERYTILLLGETGIGKSMFVNAFYNYLFYESLDDAMEDPRDLLSLIPCTFAVKENVDGRTEKRNVVVGNATEFETLKMGESGTTQPVRYTFWVRGRRVDLIDTPGIGDTGGSKQDAKNMRAIVRTLELAAIKKLSAVLLLLRPNDSRSTDRFKFCLTELMHHLHRDVAKNLIFGFTNASAENFTLGATEGPLTNLLRDLKVDITLGDRNQFFFDSTGFMTLADYKLSGRRRQDQSFHERAWTFSAKEARRLLTAVMDLHEDAHDVKQTLDMNRTRWTLQAMTRPLTEFTTSMNQSKADLENKMKEIEQLDLESKEAAGEIEKMQIEITVPVRHSLQRRKVVCGHPSCCEKHISGDDSQQEYTTYNATCHDGCGLDAPEGVRGAEVLWWCWAFSELLLFRGNPCYLCKHGWEDHLYLRSEYIPTKQSIPDEERLMQLRDMDETREEAGRILKTLHDCFDAMIQEVNQIKATRARISAYLEKNSLAAYKDATKTYLAYSISCARREGNTEQVSQLEQQKVDHEELMKLMEVDIDDGLASQLTAEDVQRSIVDLKNMKIFGKYLMEALEEDERRMRETEDESFRQITAPTLMEGIKKKCKDFWSNV